ncbi:hypothetical protein CCP1ISM_20003 [Azospirillaceae bacterium]
MICPYCETYNDDFSEVDDLLIYRCRKCDGIYCYSDDIIGKSSMPLYDCKNVSLPNLNIGDSVMCVDTKHPLFLQSGFVRELDHLHARILFKNRGLIWMNQEIIAKLPT